MRPERTLADTCRDVLVRIALSQPDKAERDAMIEIMRKDGWLGEMEEAA